MDPDLDDALDEARQKLAGAIGTVFRHSPARTYDLGVVEGMLAIIAELGGGQSPWEELLEAAAEAHYSALRSRRTFGACGCGASRMCRREETGFEVLSEVVGAGSLIDISPGDDEAPHTLWETLRQHYEAERWSIPEFGEGPGSPFDFDGVLDFDVEYEWESGPEGARTRLDERILHVLAFYDVPQTAEVVARDISPTFQVGRVLDRLVVLADEGFAHETRTSSGGAGASSRWVWTGRSTHGIEPPADEAGGREHRGDRSYPVPGKMPKALIHRMPDVEGELGFDFTALTGHVVARSGDTEFVLSVVGEITGPEMLCEVVDIVCVVYDAEGDPVARRSTSLFPGEFRWFDTFDIRIWGLDAPPERLRIYPATG